MIMQIKTKISRIFRSLYYNVIMKTSDSKEYWESRYASGGNSGVGSHGELAKFKADTINLFVKLKSIQSVVDLGCGDGDQISLFTIPQYIGLDVSKTAIEKCVTRYKDDFTKRFYHYDPESYEEKKSIILSDLSISLDVLYHLIEYEVFETYLHHLFSSSTKYVIIYSTNEEMKTRFYSTHVFHRYFTEYVEETFPDWYLIEVLKNQFPDKSRSDFYFYEKSD